ncbi:hypothetical protein [Streptomyces sp. R33]|uniref:Uncharacterized protein n=1 Tax=Streptomyces sp. R33 TaxID=3238629 RepID=A0AB39YIP2_9ACTN
MGWKGTRRTATSAALAGVVALVLAAPPPVAAEARTGTALSFGTVAARQDVQDVSPTPPPPRLPRNFRGKGKWIVQDLGITVPFTWEGRDGDSQMTAGARSTRSGSPT